MNSIRKYFPKLFPVFKVTFMLSSGHVVSIKVSEFNYKKNNDGSYNHIKWTWAVPENRRVIDVSFDINKIVAIITKRVMF